MTHILNNLSIRAKGNVESFPIHNQLKLNGLSTDFQPFRLLLFYVINPWKSSCDCNFLHSDNAPFQSNIKNSQKSTTDRYSCFVLCCDVLCIILLHFCNLARKRIPFFETKIKIYKVVFKHHRHKRDLCFNQYATLKSKSKTKTKKDRRG